MKSSNSASLSPFSSAHELGMKLTQQPGRQKSSFPGKAIALPKELNAQTKDGRASPQKAIAQKPMAHQIQVAMRMAGEAGGEASTSGRSVRISSLVRTIDQKNGSSVHVLSASSKSKGNFGTAQKSVLVVETGNFKLETIEDGLRWRKYGQKAVKGTRAIASEVVFRLMCIRWRIR